MGNSHRVLYSQHQEQDTDSGAPRFSRRGDGREAKPPLESPSPQQREAARPKMTVQAKVLMQACEILITACK